MTLIQVFYTTNELSIIFNRKYNATRRIMKNLNIKPQKLGKSIIYYLSDIKDAAPQLYESMVEAILYNDVVVIPTESEVLPSQE
jgi:hypothetical protein